MATDLRAEILARLGENYELHHRHVNRTLVQVLRQIGFDKVYARAKGAYLYDADGRDYLDFLSGYGVFNLGRNHPAIRRAIEQVLELDLPNMVQMDCSLLSGMLAERIAARTGPERDAVFLCNSGTESVEGALKFARAATGRERILAIENAFHGLSLGSLSVNGCESFREGFGNLLPGATLLRFDDLDQLEDELRRGDVAALIVEPVQGKGVRSPGDAYFPAAQRLCREHGALLICDEVQTGLGRTGKLFGYQHWDLDPDIVTLAKALSGGYVPCGAIVTRRPIYQKVFSRLDRCVVHSTTFGRNNLAMACGIAALETLDEERLCENAALRGARILERVRALQSSHELIAEARGKGLMIAVEFQEPRAFNLKLAWKTVHAIDKSLFPQMIVTTLMERRRILTQVAGHHMDVLKILPPLIIGDPEIDRFVEGLDEALGEIRRFPGPLWTFGKNLVEAALKSGYGRGARAAASPA